MSPNRMSSLFFGLFGRVYKQDVQETTSAYTEQKPSEQKPKQQSWVVLHGPPISTHSLSDGVQEQSSHLRMTGSTQQSAPAVQASPCWAQPDWQ